MKNFIINEELANAVFNYLAGRPYREVVGLMAALGQLQPVAEAPTGVDEASQSDE